MNGKIVITSASGKIGGATLNALLNYSLVPASELVIATSSRPDHPKLAEAVSLGVEIRQSNYEDIDLMTQAFSGCEKLFLVSTPHVDLDYHDCAKGGREKHHLNALAAAKRAGVSHVYYTSLAFQAPSKAAVMRAHLRTEEYLHSQRDFDFTILREGLYNESWPLYLGHYDTRGDSRNAIIIGPDGPISWTAVADLGLASALILTNDRQSWAGKTLWLSAKRTSTIADVAGVVGRAIGKDLSVEERSQEEYIRYYTEEKGMTHGEIEWWSSTYTALEDNECQISDSPLEELLAVKHRQPISIEDTIHEMLKV